MFTNFNRTLNTRLALVGAAICGIAASTASAQPWFWHREPRRDFVIRVEPRPRIVVVQQPVVVTPQVVRADVMPADLKLAAYQAADRVIITVSGINGSSGYTTSLGAGDLAAWTPTLVMHNCGPVEACAADRTPFSVTASIHAGHALAAVTIRLGEQVYQVPVTQAACLS